MHCILLQLLSVTRQHLREGWRGWNVEVRVCVPCVVDIKWCVLTHSGQLHDWIYLVWFKLSYYFSAFIVWTMDGDIVVFSLVPWMKVACLGEYALANFFWSWVGQCSSLWLQIGVYETNGWIDGMVSHRSAAVKTIYAGYINILAGLFTIMFALRLEVSFTFTNSVTSFVMLLACRLMMWCPNYNAIMPMKCIGKWIMRTSIGETVQRYISKRLRVFLDHYDSFFNILGEWTFLSGIVACWDGEFIGRYIDIVWLYYWWLALWTICDPRRSACSSGSIVGPHFCMLVCLMTCSW